MLTIGWVNFINHEMQNNSNILKNIAQIKPTDRALACCSIGSFDDIIDRNTMLSTPKTISRKVRVSKAIHAEGSKKVSKISMSKECF